MAPSGELLPVAAPKGVPGLLRALRAFLGEGSLRAAAALLRQPLLLCFLLQIAQALRQWWIRHCRLSLGRHLVLGTAQGDLDVELIQGCLLSTEHLLTFGRVEKRTLFTRPLLEVLGGNEHLVQELLKAAVSCRKRSSNCLVTRWMPEDERYHALQAALNVASSLFGPNYVHFNALDGERTGAFKSTWYCLTIVTPTRPNASPPKLSDPYAVAQTPSRTTCTFTDMSRMPRATLRICLANESELRRIADGKLRQPNWGFFNTRHAERFRVLCDFARNFQMQLVRSPADGRSMGARSPFTSEKVHAAPSTTHKPDAGQMKRVQSQPALCNMKMASAPRAFRGAPGSGQLQEKERDPTKSRSVSAGRRAKLVVPSPGPDDAQDEEDGAAENNCFLRLHVPHFVKTGSSMPPLPSLSPGPYESEGGD